MARLKAERKVRPRSLAERPVKPRSLANPKKTKPAAQTIMNENATRSPLLRLTPELRNRIYKLALSPGGIHIYGGGKRFTHYVCVAPGSNITSTTDWQTCLHAHCLTRAVSFESHTSSLLDLSLLRVCKQIHQEAALMPFTLNTFYVESLSQLSWLSDRLLTAQRRAIASVRLDDENHCLAWPRQKTEKIRIARLKGLKKLTLSLDSDCLQAYLSAYLKLLPDRLHEVFSPLPLADVSVIPRAVGCDSHVAELLAKPVPEWFANVARGIEKMLLSEGSK